MSLPVPRELIDKAVMRFESEARRKTRESPPSPPRVITLSRQLGAGGRRIAETLRERLGWPLWDKEILEVVASQSHLHYQARMFEALDESTQGAIENAAYAMLGGVSKDVYLYLLPRAILTVAQNDAVILGRGAHLLLPEALKVRVEASLETRVKNLVRFEGLTEKAARERIATSDQEREGFLRELAARLSRKGTQQEKWGEYDLTINTDRFSVQEAATIILSAAKQRFGVEVDQPRVAASG